MDVTAFAQPAPSKGLTRRALPTGRPCPRRRRTTRTTLRTGRLPPCCSAGPQQATRTAVVTGATGGIGIPTCKALVEKLSCLSHLILCTRDASLANHLVDMLRTLRSDVCVDVVHVELSDSLSVVSATRTIIKLLGCQPLDLFIANAGIMASPLSFATLHDAKQAPLQIERQYFVNHISHGMMTTLLLPKRIIFVSSLANALVRHKRSVPLTLDKTAGPVTSSYNRWGAYADSKLAMSLFARGVALRHMGTVQSVSVHPGVVQTRLARFVAPAWAMARMRDRSIDEAPGVLNRVLSGMFGLKLPHEGAALIVDLAIAPKDALQNGAMYVGLHGKVVHERLVPLLQNDAQCLAVVRDVDWVTQMCTGLNADDQKV